MGVAALLDGLGLTGAAYAVPVLEGDGIGHHPDDLVAPASVMKIQVALATLDAIARGAIDGSARRVMTAERRTPGPVGVSLMRDDVVMSVRDLVTAMLTISDNVATDELIDLLGVDVINRLTDGLGLSACAATAAPRGRQPLSCRRSGPTAPLLRTLALTFAG